MPSNGVTYIVYDGGCPFCSRYVKMLRLRKAIGAVELLNAREAHPIVSMLKSKGIDLDDGMALVRDEEISIGDDCIHKLALMSTPNDLFNRINCWIFNSPTASRLLYPILRLGRNATLKLLKIKKLSESPPHP